MPGRCCRTEVRICGARWAATRAGHVHQREDVGIRVEVAQHFQRLLAAAHAGQPVVHQRDPRVTRGHLAGRCRESAAPIAPRKTAGHAGQAARPEVGAQRRIGQHARHRVRDRGGVRRIDQQRRVAGHFRQRRDVGRDDRRAARHRFERRQAEALVERRKHEHRGQAIDSRERLVGQEAEEPHVLVQVRSGAPHAAATRTSRSRRR